MNTSGKVLVIAVILLFIGLAFAPSINANIGKRTLKYSKPDICCEGELYWLDAEPGETATGHFEVGNCGEEGSLLGCEIIDWPDWGTWTIDPMSWNDQAPEDGPVTVDVEVIAPDEINEDLWGEIKVINLGNPDDFCEISVFWREKSIDNEVLESTDFHDTNNHFVKQGQEICPTNCFLVEIRNITGGFGVHAEIVSGTNKDLYDVGWKISLSEGGLLLIGKKRTGMIDTLHAGETVKIWNFVFGIFGYGVMYNIRISLFYNGGDIGGRDALGQVFGPYVRNIFVDPPII